MFSHLYLKKENKHHLNFKAMTDYWKSNAKKYCEYCKVWVYDNKAVSRSHNFVNMSCTVKS